KIPEPVSSGDSQTINKKIPVTDAPDIMLDKINPISNTSSGVERFQIAKVTKHAKNSGKLKRKKIVEDLSWDENFSNFIVYEYEENFQEEDNKFQKKLKMSRVWRIGASNVYDNSLNICIMIYSIKYNMLLHNSFIVIK
ncbi:hypothetical protein V1478_003113, partial [Vespula squamosa]